MSERRRGLRFHAGAEGIRIALASLRENLFRSGLTILGVAIGVSVVVIMAGLVTGIRTSVVESLEAAGPDNFFVSRFDLSEVRIVNDGTGRPPWWGMPKITLAEVARIQGLPGVSRAVVSSNLAGDQFQGGIVLEYQGRRVENVTGQGNDAGWPDHTAGEFLEGRDFVPAEVSRGVPVMVLSVRTAEELFGDLAAVGRRVRASVEGQGSGLFTVVGVFSPGENIFGEAANEFVVFPYTTAFRRLKGRDDFLQIVVVPEAGYPRDLVQDQVITALRSMRGLGPGEENNFAILQADQIIQLFDQFTGVFFVVMIALSSVGLMVGGVGVVGIMLISVTERTREIGVRKALGATRREILWQFLVEASLLTGVGGALGLLMGGGLASLVAAVTPIPAEIPIWAVIVSLAMAVVTGMLFGLVPALRAARMEPVVALRYE